MTDALAGSGPDLCFVSAVGGSVFMDELLEVVADAVRRAGGRARTVTGVYPEPDADTVYVVVPHEYLVVTPEALRPPPALLRRTIGFGVEHPGTGTFERAAALMPSLGGAVDINADSVAEFRARGIQARHVQLGWSPLWDAWGGADTPRPVDVTYLGTAERRRSLLLASYWRDLDHLRTRLLTPPHEPMRAERVDFLPGRAKHTHLARSRVIVNLHRERSTAFEWVRALEAMCNGCVVVSEPSRDLEPLVVGEHLVVAAAANVGAVAAALLAQPGREAGIRAAAYDFVRTELDMRRSAAVLVEAAEDVLRADKARIAANVSTQAAPRRRLFGRPRAAGTAVQATDADVAAVVTAQWRAAAATMAAAGHRVLAGPPVAAVAPLAIDTPPYDPRLPRPTLADAPAASSSIDDDAADVPRPSNGSSWTAPAVIDPDGVVDVLIVRGPGEPDPWRLVVDVASGTTAPRTVLVCADGGEVTPAPAPHVLLAHEAPLGRGRARNRLLDRSTAPWVLVLDAGNRASPHLLTVLLRHADELPDAAVVFCPVGDADAGLVNALPPESRRLRTTAYLGGGYLVRRSVLDAIGGWSEDPHLAGLEDHVFWLRVADDGLRVALAQQVLLTRVRPDGPRRPADVRPGLAWRAAEAHVSAGSPPAGSRSGR